MLAQPRGSLRSGGVVTRRLWQLATIALIASAIVIWHEVLRAKEAAPREPLAPFDPQMLVMPSQFVTCYPEYVAVITSARHGNKVVCAPSKGAQ